MSVVFGFIARNVIVSIASRLAAKYFDGVDRDKLQFALLAGEVSLENIRLKDEILAKLNLPVTLLSVEIGYVKLKIPVYAPLSGVWQITVSGVRVVVKPRESPRPFPETVEAAAARRVKELDDLDDAFKFKKRILSALSGHFGATDKVVRNLHFRMEALTLIVHHHVGETAPSLRVRIDEFCLYSADGEDWRVAEKPTTELIFKKRLTLRGLSATPLDDTWRHRDEAARAHEQRQAAQKTAPKQGRSTAAVVGRAFAAAVGDPIDRLLSPKGRNTNASMPFAVPAGGGGDESGESAGGSPTSAAAFADTVRTAEEDAILYLSHLDLRAKVQTKPGLDIDVSASLGKIRSSMQLRHVRPPRCDAGEGRHCAKCPDCLGDVCVTTALRRTMLRLQQHPVRPYHHRLSEEGRGRDWPRAMWQYAVRCVVLNIQKGALQSTSNYMGYKVVDAKAKVREEYRALKVAEVRKTLTDVERRLLAEYEHHLPKSLLIDVWTEVLDETSGDTWFGGAPPVYSLPDLTYSASFTLEHTACPDDEHGVARTGEEPPQVVARLIDADGSAADPLLWFDADRISAEAFFTRGMAMELAREVVFTDDGTNRLVTVTAKNRLLTTAVGGAAQGYVAPTAELDAAGNLVIDALGQTAAVPWRDRPRVLAELRRLCEAEQIDHALPSRTLTCHVPISDVHCRYRDRATGAVCEVLSVPGTIKLQGHREKRVQQPSATPAGAAMASPRRNSVADDGLPHRRHRLYEVTSELVLLAYTRVGVEASFPLLHLASRLLLPPLPPLFSSGGDGRGAFDELDSTPKASNWQATPVAGAACDFPFVDPLTRLPHGRRGPRDEPDLMVTNAGLTLSMVEGRFVSSGVARNGYPTWNSVCRDACGACAVCGRACLYSTTGGRWMVGPTDGVTRNLGWLVCATTHGGVLPHMVGCRWHEVRQDQWCESSICVSADMRQNDDGAAASSSGEADEDLLSGAAWSDVPDSTDDSNDAAEAVAAAAVAAGDDDGGNVDTTSGGGGAVIRAVNSLRVPQNLAESDTATSDVLSSRTEQAPRPPPLQLGATDSTDLSAEGGTGDGADGDATDGCSFHSPRSGGSTFSVDPFALPIHPPPPHPPPPPPPPQFAQLRVPAAPSAVASPRSDGGGGLGGSDFPHLASSSGMMTVLSPVLSPLQHEAPLKDAYSDANSTEGAPLVVPRPNREAAARDGDRVRFYTRPPTLTAGGQVRGGGIGEVVTMEYDGERVVVTVNGRTLPATPSVFRLHLGGSPRLDLLAFVPSKLKANSLTLQLMRGGRLPLPFTGLPKLLGDIRSIAERARVPHHIPDTLQSVSETRLTKPSGVSCGANGALYIADSWNHRILRWIPGCCSGNVVAGGNGLGPGLQQLAYPTGVCAVSAGLHAQTHLYVADTQNHRVQRWDVDAEKVEPCTVAGFNGKGSNAWNLCYPSDVAMGPDGNLYICDTGNNRVLKWRVGKQQYEAVVAGSHSGLRGTSLSLLDTPKGLCVDSDGAVYIADTLNHRVVRWDYGASVGTLAAGTGESGSLAHHLRKPQAVAVRQDKSLLVSDTGNNRVQLWSSGCHAGVTVKYGMRTPKGLCLGPSKELLFVVDSHNNTVFQCTPPFTTVSITEVKGEWGELSPYYPEPFVFEGVEYRCIHECYSLCVCSDGWFTKLTDEPRLYTLLMAAFMHRTTPRMVLAATENQPIRYISPTDSAWGTGADGRGKNAYGRVLARVRSELTRSPLSLGLHLKKGVSFAFPLTRPSTLSKQWFAVLQATDVKLPISGGAVKTDDARTPRFPKDSDKVRNMELHVRGCSLGMEARGRLGGLLTVKEILALRESDATPAAAGKKARLQRLTEAIGDVAMGTESPLLCNCDISLQAQLSLNYEDQSTYWIAAACGLQPSSGCSAVGLNFSPRGVLLLNDYIKELVEFTGDVFRQPSKAVYRSALGGWMVAPPSLIAQGLGKDKTRPPRLNYLPHTLVVERERFSLQDRWVLRMYVERGEAPVWPCGTTDPSFRERHGERCVDPIGIVLLSSQLDLSEKPVQMDLPDLTGLPRLDAALKGLQKLSQPAGANSGLAEGSTSFVWRNICRAPVALADAELSSKLPKAAVDNLKVLLSPGHPPSTPAAAYRLLVKVNTELTTLFRTSYAVIWTVRAGIRGSEPLRVGDRVRVRNSPSESWQYGIIASIEEPPEPATASGSAAVHSVAKVTAAAERDTNSTDVRRYNVQTLSEKDELYSKGTKCFKFAERNEEMTLCVMRHHDKKEAAKLLRVLREKALENDVRTEEYGGIGMSVPFATPARQVWPEKHGRLDANGLPDPSFFKTHYYFSAPSLELKVCDPSCSTQYVMQMQGLFVETGSTFYDAVTDAGIKELQVWERRTRPDWHAEPLRRRLTEAVTMTSSRNVNAMFVQCWRALADECGQGATTDARRGLFSPPVSQEAHVFHKLLRLSSTTPCNTRRFPASMAPECGWTLHEAFSPTNARTPQPWLHPEELVRGPLGVYVCLIVSRVDKSLWCDTPGQTSFRAATILGDVALDIDRNTLAHEVYNANVWMDPLTGLPEALTRYAWPCFEPIPNNSPAVCSRSLLELSLDSVRVGMGVGGVSGFHPVFRLSVPPPGCWVSVKMDSRTLLTAVELKAGRVELAAVYANTVNTLLWLKTQQVWGVEMTLTEQSDGVQLTRKVGGYVGNVSLTCSAGVFRQLAAFFPVAVMTRVNEEYTVLRYGLPLVDASLQDELDRCRVVARGMTRYPCHAVNTLNAWRAKVLRGELRPHVTPAPQTQSSAPTTDINFVVGKVALFVPYATEAAAPAGGPSAAEAKARPAKRAGDTLTSCPAICLAVDGLRLSGTNLGGAVAGPGDKEYAEVSLGFVRDPQLASAATTVVFEKLRFRADVESRDGAVGVVLSVADAPGGLRIGPEAVKRMVAAADAAQGTPEGLVPFHVLRYDPDVGVTDDAGDEESYGSSAFEDGEATDNSSIGRGRGGEGDGTTRQLRTPRGRVLFGTAEAVADIESNDSLSLAASPRGYEDEEETAAESRTAALYAYTCVFKLATADIDVYTSGKIARKMFCKLRVRDISLRADWRDLSHPAMQFATADEAAAAAAAAASGAVPEESGFGILDGATPLGGRSQPTPNAAAAAAAARRFSAYSHYTLQHDAPADRTSPEITQHSSPAGGVPPRWSLAFELQQPRVMLSSEMVQTTRPPLAYNWDFSAPASTWSAGGQSSTTAADAAAAAARKPSFTWPRTSPDTPEIRYDESTFTSTPFFSRASGGAASNTFEERLESPREYDDSVAPLLRYVDGGLRDVAECCRVSTQVVFRPTVVGVSLEFLQGAVRFIQQIGDEVDIASVSGGGAGSASGGSVHASLLSLSSSASPAQPLMSPAEDSGGGFDLSSLGSSRESGGGEAGGGSGERVGKDLIAREGAPLVKTGPYEYEWAIEDTEVSLNSRGRGDRWVVAPDAALLPTPDKEQHALTVHIRPKRYLILTLNCIGDGADGEDEHAEGGGGAAGRREAGGGSAAAAWMQPIVLQNMVSLVFTNTLFRISHAHASVGGNRHLGTKKQGAEMAATLVGHYMKVPTFSSVVFGANCSVIPIQGSAERPAYPVRIPRGTTRGTTQANEGAEAGQDDGGLSGLLSSGVSFSCRNEDFSIGFERRIGLDEKMFGFFAKTEIEMRVPRQGDSSLTASLHELGISCTVGAGATGASQQQAPSQPQQKQPPPRPPSLRSLSGGGPASAPRALTKDIVRTHPIVFSVRREYHPESDEFAATVSLEGKVPVSEKEANGGAAPDDPSPSSSDFRCGAGGAGNRSRLLADLRVCSGDVLDAKDVVKSFARALRARGADPFATDSALSDSNDDFKSATNTTRSSGWRSAAPAASRTGSPAAAAAAAAASGRPPRSRPNGPPGTPVMPASLLRRRKGSPAAAAAAEAAEAAGARQQSRRASPIDDNPDASEERNYVTATLMRADTYHKEKSHALKRERCVHMRRCSINLVASLDPMRLTLIDDMYGFDLEMLRWTCDLFETTGDMQLPMSQSVDADVSSLCSDVTFTFYSKLEVHNVTCGHWDVMVDMGQMLKLIREKNANTSQYRQSLTVSPWLMEADREDAEIATTVTISAHTLLGLIHIFRRMAGLGLEPTKGSSKLKSSQRIGGGTAAGARTPSYTVKNESGLPLVIADPDGTEQLLLSSAYQHRLRLSGDTIKRLGRSSGRLTLSSSADIADTAVAGSAAAVSVSESAPSPNSVATSTPRARQSEDSDDSGSAGSRKVVFRRSGGRCYVVASRTSRDTFRAHKLGVRQLLQKLCPGCPLPRVVVHTQVKEGCLQTTVRSVLSLRNEFDFTLVVRLRHPAPGVLSKVLPDGVDPAPLLIIPPASPLGNNHASVPLFFVTKGASFEVRPLSAALKDPSVAPAVLKRLRDAREAAGLRGVEEGEAREMSCLKWCAPVTSREGHVGIPAYILHKQAAAQGDVGQRNRNVTALCEVVKSPPPTHAELALVRRHGLEGGCYLNAVYKPSWRADEVPAAGAEDEMHSRDMDIVLRPTALVTNHLPYPVLYTIHAAPVAHEGTRVHVLPSTAPDAERQDGAPGAGYDAVSPQQRTPQAQHQHPPAIRELLTELRQMVFSDKWSSSVEVRVHKLLKSREHGPALEHVFAGMGWDSGKARFKHPPSKAFVDELSIAVATAAHPRLILPGKSAPLLSVSLRRDMYVSFHVLSGHYPLYSAPVALPSPLDTPGVDHTIPLSYAPPTSQAQAASSRATSVMVTHMLSPSASVELVLWAPIWLLPQMDPDTCAAMHIVRKGETSLIRKYTDVLTGHISGARRGEPFICCPSVNTRSRKEKMRIAVDGSELSAPFDVGDVGSRTVTCRERASGGQDGLRFVPITVTTMAAPSEFGRSRIVSFKDQFIACNHLEFAVEIRLAALGDTSLQTFLEPGQAKPISWGCANMWSEEAHKLFSKAVHEGVLPNLQVCIAGTGKWSSVFPPTILSGRAKLYEESDAFKACVNICSSIQSFVSFIEFTPCAAPLFQVCNSTAWAAEIWQEHERTKVTPCDAMTTVDCWLDELLVTPPVLIKLTYGIGEGRMLRSMLFEVDVSKLGQADNAIKFKTKEDESPFEVNVRLGGRVVCVDIIPSHHTACLHVTVVSAGDLMGRDRHLCGGLTSDPFCRLTVDGRLPRSGNAMTATIANTCDPVWETPDWKSFPLFPHESTLNISLWDEDIVVDDFLGQVSMPVGRELVGTQGRRRLELQARPGGGDWETARKQGKHDFGYVVIEYSVTAAHAPHGVRSPLPMTEAAEDEWPFVVRVTSSLHLSVCGEVAGRLQEIVFVDVTGVDMLIVREVNGQYTGNIEVGLLQVDNCLGHADFHVILGSREVATQKPAMRLAFAGFKVKSHLVLAEYLGLYLQPVKVTLGDADVLSLFAGFAECRNALWYQTIGYTELLKMFMKLPKPVGETQTQHLYFRLGEVFLHKIKPEITWLGVGHATGDRQLFPLLQSWGLSFFCIDAAKVSLPEYRGANLLSRRRELYTIFLRHYLPALLRSSVILLGASAVGNPTAVFSSLYNAVYHFVSQIAAALREDSLGGVGKGIVKGGALLVGHTITAILTFIAAICAMLGGLLGAIDSFAGSEVYQSRLRIHLRVRRPRGFVQGVKDGCLRLFDGFYLGITGVVLEPYNGGTKGGLAGGLRGVVTGVVGLTMKPPQGIFTFISTVAEGGIAYISGPTRSLRRRPPRVVINGVLSPYNRRCSEVYAMLCLLNIMGYSGGRGRFADEYYMHHAEGRTADTYYVVTTHRVVHFYGLSDREAVTMLWSVELADIRKLVAEGSSGLVLHQRRRRAKRRVELQDLSTSMFFAHMLLDADLCPVDEVEMSTSTRLLYNAEELPDAWESLNAGDPAAARNAHTVNMPHGGVGGRTAVNTPRNARSFKRSARDQMLITQMMKRRDGYTLAEHLRRMIELLSD